jgi:3-oxoacyl-[acyl-carrier-protein] synthase II
MKKVVITGMSAISAISDDIIQFKNSLKNGKSGIQPFSNWYSTELRSALWSRTTIPINGYISKDQATFSERFAHLGIISSKQALTQAKIRVEDLDSFESGVFVGNIMGGNTTLDQGYISLLKENQSRVKPFTIIQAMGNSAAAMIGIENQLKGPNQTFCNACSSSAVAIGEAFRKIQYGEVTTMIAGGTESKLTYGCFKAWDALRVLATVDQENPASSCKPFSKNRTGFVLGEGAAMLVLEEMEHAIARGAPIIAELVGYATTNDATHITQPDVDGQARTMAMAIKDAGLNPGNIDYINAHGTATLVGDLHETLAIKKVFGDYAYQIPISSTKAMHGHMMGATGAIEFIAALSALQTGIIPPTINLDQPDPALDLDYVPNVARDVKSMGGSVDVVMSNSFAFGGCNAVLVAKRFNG